MTRVRITVVVGESEMTVEHDDRFEVTRFGDDDIHHAIELLDKQVVKVKRALRSDTVNEHEFRIAPRELDIFTSDFSAPHELVHRLYVVIMTEIAKSCPYNEHLIDFSRHECRSCYRTVIRIINALYTNAMAPVESVQRVYPCDCDCDSCGDAAVADGSKRQTRLLCEWTDDVVSGKEGTTTEQV